MIETWADTLCKVWGFACGDGRSVRSFNLVANADFPAAINPANDFPLALTIPSGMQAQYSAGGPRIGIWSGVTEFHVSPNLERSLMPSLVRWYGLILAAAAGNITLDGLVEHFWIPDQEDAISGPLGMQYGIEAEHWGFLVRWYVKEHLTLTVG